MSDLYTEIQDSIALLTIDRVHKQNAFDNHLLSEMQSQLDSAIQDAKVKIILLKANGTNFCAGADLAWMQSMINLNEEENLKDSLILANVMYTLYHSPKPTLTVIQGAAFGGGAGLAAASDIAIAADTARFCFSEVKLGLIPAVISPYVVQAIGARNAQMLFMSAELIEAKRALELNLIQHCVKEQNLMNYSLQYAQQISNNAPEAVVMSKKLVREVAQQEINLDLVHYTATRIAQKRISEEGQKGLHAFLNKKIQNWN